MDTSKFAADLATVLKAGISRSEHHMGAASAAYRRLSADADTRFAAQVFFNELGLKAFENPTRSRVYLVPDTGNSLFAMKSGVARTKVNSDARSAMLALAFLLVLGTFYPSRKVLNQGTLLGITVEDVFATSLKIMDIVRKDKEVNGVKVETLADEWQKLPERDNAKGTKPAFQEFYVIAALKLLQEHKQAVYKEAEGKWYPTERLAMTVVMRFDASSTIAAEILSALHDQNETE